MTWANVEGLDWEGLIGVDVEGLLLISKAPSFGWVTIAATGMIGVAIGFLVILMPDLNGNVSDGAGGWDNGKKKSVANIAWTVMFVIVGNRDTIACISFSWSVSSIKIKWSNLFIQIKFNLYR